MPQVHHYEQKGINQNAVAYLYTKVTDQVVVTLWVYIQDVASSNLGQIIGKTD
jgi:hypothetical protein